MRTHAFIARLGPSIILLLLMSLSFACVRENSSQQGVRYEQSLAADSAFELMNNSGQIDSYIQERFLHVTCQASTYARPVGLRVYDNNGDLLYVARDPACNETTPVEIDMRYAEEGDYQLLMYFDNGAVIEDWIAYR